MPLWRVLRALPLVLLIAASGCQKAAWTKVVATDGSVTVGELVESRPDAVVVRTPQGTQVTILRSRIRSLEMSTPAEVAAATQTAPAAARPPASGSSLPAAPPSPTAVPAAAVSIAPTQAPQGGAQPPIAAVQIAPSSPRSPRGTTPPSTSHNSTVLPAPASEAASEATPAATPAAAPPPTVAAAPVGRSAMMLAARLDTALASDDSELEDEVEATLLNPVVVDGRQLVPAGTTVKGTVIESGKNAEGRPEIAVRFTGIARGEDDIIPIQASVIRWSGSVQQVPASEAQSGSFMGKIKKGLGMNKTGMVTVVKPARVVRGTPIDITLEAPLSPR